MRHYDDPMMLRMLAAGRVAGVALAAMGAGALAACSVTPAEPYVDKLDPDTATTTTVLAEPVELVSDSLRTANGDPFVYVAPFETDQMGARALYLWISVPQNNGPVTQPKLLCDGREVEMQSLGSDPAQLKLSRPPYSLPTPWSGQWFFQLPRNSLDCLVSAQAIEIDAQSSQGAMERFTTTAKALRPLQAFAHR